MLLGESYVSFPTAGPLQKVDSEVQGLGGSETQPDNSRYVHNKRVTSGTAAGRGGAPVTSPRHHPQPPP
jgi:hypothetical protein